MPQRISHILAVVVGLAGLALLAAMWLAGADVKDAIRAGPGWKRTLLSAAVILLGIVGIVPAREGSSQSSSSQAADDRLTPSPQWQRISAIWQEADDIRSGRRGRSPLDEQRMKRALDGLDAAVRDVQDLQATGLVDAEEGNLLIEDLASLNRFIASRMSPGLQRHSALVAQG